MQICFFSNSVSWFVILKFYNVKNLKTMLFKILFIFPSILERLYIFLHVSIFQEPIDITIGMTQQQAEKIAKNLDFTGDTLKDVSFIHFTMILLLF